MVVVGIGVGTVVVVVLMVVGRGLEQRVLGEDWVRG